MKTTTYNKALSKLKKIRESLIWTTKNMDELVVAEMEYEHVQNTIVYLAKRQEEFTKYKVGEMRINDMTANEWIEIFREELKFRDSEQ
jgi:hypothetical protein